MINITLAKNSKLQEYINQIKNKSKNLLMAHVDEIIPRHNDQDFQSGHIDHPWDEHTDKNED